MNRENQLKDELNKALSRLEEACETAISELEIDGAIQRFEFTFELFWKYFQVYLEHQGISANSPRSVFKELYKIELIKDEKLWLGILEDRNLSTHTYSESASREIYMRVKQKYMTAFQSVLSQINI
jgi:nucleotidyltransferase substrate binding protein (TIGR01987 family)